MDYISTKEAALKWGISPTRITILASEGRIPGAQHLGKSWMIPSDAAKPEARKGGIAGRRPEPKPDSFSFPLYPYRPDWDSAKEKRLSLQQKSLLAAEIAVLECRFDDARTILETILAAPENICTEIGALWNAGMCCLAQNRPADFSRILLRLQMLLAEDFPHRDDLAIVIAPLKTYVEPMRSASDTVPDIPNIHAQALPLANILAGYAELAKEAANPGSANTLLLEITLRFQENTSSLFASEMLHLYLLGIYALRQNTEKAEEHAKAVVRLAYRTKVYFPLISYYHYYDPFFAPVLEEYPEEFQTLCHDLSARYKKNYAAFTASIGEESTVTKLTPEDYPYIFAVLGDVPNTRLAKKLGISCPTVKRRLEKLYEKLGVIGKEELKEFLRINM